MRGIPVKRLIELHKKSHNTEHKFLYNWLIAQECHELQEPWIPLDEFLKSGFVGLCFVLIDGVVEEAKFYGQKFTIPQRHGTYKTVDKDRVTRVIPINKPEPPR